MKMNNVFLYIDIIYLFVCFVSPNEKANLPSRYLTQVTDLLFITDEKVNSFLTTVPPSRHFIIKQMSTVSNPNICQAYIGKKQLS